MKRISCILATIFCCMLFSSCRSANQVDELLLVQAIGIDKSISGYDISLQTYDTRKSGGKSVVTSEGTNIKLVNCSGETIYTALKSAELLEGEKIFTGHNMIIVLGESVTETDIRDTLSYFVEDEVTFPGVKIATSKKAKDIVGFKIDKDVMSSIAIVEEIEKSIENGITAKAHLVNVVSNLSGISQSCVIPNLEVSYDENDDGNIVVSSNSVFSSEKLVGELTKKESMGLLWLIDEVDTMYFPVKYTNIKTGIYVDNAKISTKPVIMPDGSVQIDTKIKCDAKQMDLSCVVDKKDDEEILKRQVKEEIEGQCTACLSRITQDLKVDILGVGNLLKLKNKELYNQYLQDTESFIENISYNLKITVNIVK